MNLTMLLNGQSQTVTFNPDTGVGTLMSLGLTSSEVSLKSTPGAIELVSSSQVTNKGVTRTVIQCRVPLYSIPEAAENYLASSSNSNNAHASCGAGYAQVSLTVTLPNAAGVISDSATLGAKPTQAHYNAIGVELALQVLLALVLKPGSNAATVVLHDMSEFATGFSSPLVRGLSKMTPVDPTTNRGFYAGV